MSRLDSEPVGAERLEDFAALRLLDVRHGFVGRVPGVDVLTDRATALSRLDGFHSEARRILGLEGRQFVTAEQVHCNRVAVIAEGDIVPVGPISGADALVTDRTDLCLGIYTADCAAIYLVDPMRRVIGLVHSGRKGTDLSIVSAAVNTMSESFGTRPEDVTAQLSPCIRPPWYEVDFAAQIITQCHALGLGYVSDCHACTAADPDRYYSYRREKGRTGRMLALLALR